LLLTWWTTDILPFLEYSADRKHVRCTVCNGERKATIKDTIQSKNFKAHLASPTHVACNDNRLARESARVQQEAEISKSYDAQSVMNYQDAPIPIALYHPPMFPEQYVDRDVDMACPEIDDAHLMEQLGQTMSAERIITPEETRLLLEQEFQRMLEEAHRETHFGDDVGDQFVGDDLPKEFDEEEDDDCWDRSVLEHSEYRPYPNKTASQLD
jgi:hypothetical protein